MKLNEVNVALDHRIVSGSEYQWRCFGTNARYMDYESSHAYASVIYDTQTLDIYEATINDKEDLYRYRYINANFLDAYKQECETRNISFKFAWDTCEWYDLELAEDWLEKASKIFKGIDFDKRIQVPLELEDNELLHLALEAHKRDVTLNKMVEILLQEAIDHKLSTV